MRIFVFMMLVVIVTGISHRYQRDVHRHSARESVIKTVPQANIAFQHRARHLVPDSRYHRLIWYSRTREISEYYFI